MHRTNIYIYVAVILLCLLSVTLMSIKPGFKEAFTMLHHGAKTSTATPFALTVPPFSALGKLIKPNRVAYPTDPPDVKYVFWTGGLFSTYRLIDLMLRLKTRVRPVYIIPTGIDKRTTTRDELLAMQAIRGRFKEAHRSHVDLFLDTYMVNIDVVHEEVRRQSDKVFGKRATRIYAAMVQASYELSSSQRIEWVLNDYSNQERLRSHIVGLVTQSAKQKDRCTYMPENSSSDVFSSMFSKIKFIMTNCPSGQHNMTSETARKHKFLPILQKYTWSCRYPQTKGRSAAYMNKKQNMLQSPRHHVPCNSCPQCISRREWFAAGNEKKEEKQEKEKEERPHKL